MKPLAALLSSQLWRTLDLHSAASNSLTSSLLSPSTLGSLDTGGLEGGGGFAIRHTGSEPPFLWQFIKEPQHIPVRFPFAPATVLQMQKTLKGRVERLIPPQLFTAQPSFFSSRWSWREQKLVEWICFSVLPVLFLAVQARYTTRKAIISPRARQNAINPASISPSPRRGSLVCIIWAFAVFSLLQSIHFWSICY